ncbi:TolC family protein [Persephonella sp.]
MRNIVLVLLLISFSTYGVTLDQLIQQALVNSPYLKQKRIKKEIYSEKEKQVKRLRFGSFYLFGSYEHYSEKTNLGFLNPDKGIAGMVFANNFYGLGVGYNVPLFTGFRLETDLKITQIGKKLAETEEKLTKNQLIYRIKSIYLQILSLEKQRKAVESYINSLRRLKKNISIAVKAGKKAEVDLLKVDYQLKEAVTDLNKVMLKIEDLKYSLKTLIGKEDIVIDRLDDLEESSPVPKVRNNYNNLLYVKKEQLNKIRAKNFIKKQKSSFYPQIDLDMAYSKKYALGESFDFYKISLNIRYTLFDFGRRASAVSEGKKEYLFYKEMERSALLNLKKEINETLHKIKIYEEELSSARKRIEFAREIERIEEIKYENGVSDIFDLLKAKSDRILAETKFYEAFYKRETEIAYLNYLISEE